MLICAKWHAVFISGNADVRNSGETRQCGERMEGKHLNHKEANEELLKNCEEFISSPKLRTIGTEKGVGKSQR